MIDENIMNQIVPLPDKNDQMEKMKAELMEQGFVINNFNKGGVFHLLLFICIQAGLEIKQLARTIINSCFMLHTTGDWAEIKAADYSKTRKEAIKTKGYITIHRSDDSNALKITKGHMFKTLPDVNGRELKYYVLTETILEEGLETGKVLVEAEFPGTDYNVSLGKITISMIHLEGVSSIGNEDGWLSEVGTEVEDIESLRKRCMGSYSELAERTIEEKLINTAKRVPGVLSVMVDAQHPRGQATVDVIVTSSAGEATEELLRKVEKEIEHLKGNYEDYLVKSSEIVRQDFEIIIYMDAAVSIENVDRQAEKLIEDLMQLTRQELNILYRDSIIKQLSTINGYKKSDIIHPDQDVELENGKVITLGEVTITVKNITKKV